MWIGGNGYPVQFRVDGKAQGQATTTTIRYSRFNDPKIRVSAPEPGQRELDPPTRMREPMTVAKVARGIDTLFASPDYSTDPCPRIHANLANLNTGGDRALVDEEVRRLRRLCQ
jgi:hypothetical protein